MKKAKLKKGYRRTYVEAMTFLLRECVYPGYDDARFRQVARSWLMAALADEAKRS